MIPSCARKGFTVVKNVSISLPALALSAVVSCSTRQCRVWSSSSVQIPLLHLLFLRRDEFFEDRVQPARDLPVRIILLEFPQVRDVADVIALSSFLHITPRQFLAARFLDAFD